MKNSRKIIILVAIVFAAMSNWIVIAQAQLPASPNQEMSVWRAMYQLSFATKYAFALHCGGNCHYYAINGQTVRRVGNDLTFEATNNKGEMVQFSIAMNALPVLSGKCTQYWCVVNAGQKVFYFSDTAEKKKYYLAFDAPDRPKNVCETAQDTDACLKSADLFAKSMNALRAYALAHPAGSEDFHQQAAAWRALVSKPSMTEATRVYRLAAEDALDHKEPAEALNYYELGVQANSTWALGWYNAALIAGEIGDYAAAADHMQNYLELSPDAEDAQVARDKADLWKFKASRPAAKSN